MITEPIWVEMPRTCRDYDEYIKECARARGWNEAMAFIFAQELEEENKKITSCWLRDSEGDWLCKTCQRREYCEVTL